MPALSGVKLEELVDLASEWYAQTRLKLIEEMSHGKPYGTILLSPAEQLERFMEMQPEDWEAMLIQLQETYRGLPDGDARAEKDLQNYLAKMTKLNESRGA